MVWHGVKVQDMLHQTMLVCRQYTLRCPISSVNVPPLVIYGTIKRLIDFCRMVRIGILFLQMRVRVTETSTRPQQQLCCGAHEKLVFILLLYCVRWRCGLVCHLAGYDVGVIEMLLMMSGDIEPNPGPGE